MGDKAHNLNQLRKDSILYVSSPYTTSTAYGTFYGAYASGWFGFPLYSVDPVAIVKSGGSEKSDNCKEDVWGEERFCISIAGVSLRIVQSFKTSRLFAFRVYFSMGTGDFCQKACWECSGICSNWSLRPSWQGWCTFPSWTPGTLADICKAALMD